MKLRQISVEKKNEYLKRMMNSLQNYDSMIKSIDQKFAKYGSIHFNQTQNVLNVTYAREQKEILKVEIKNINTAALDQIISDLKVIKEEYIKEVTPEVSAINDPLELSFIEKELKVMTDGELLDYYKENYLDANITRLIRIEYKVRHGYKDGKTVMPLPEYGIEDLITSKIDKEIKLTVGLRQITGTMCSFVAKLDETGTQIPKMISWSTIFGQIETRNLKGFTKVSLLDFI